MVKLNHQPFPVMHEQFTRAKYRVRTHLLMSRPRTKVFERWQKAWLLLDNAEQLYYFSQWVKPNFPVQATRKIRHS